MEEEGNPHLRAERKAHKRPKKSNVAWLEKKRKGKETKLNRLTSISGGKNGGGASEIICHKCGLRGHRQANCPQWSNEKRKNGFDDRVAAKKTKISLDY